jgi:hypothetical protein
MPFMTMWKNFVQSGRPKTTIRHMSMPAWYLKLQIHPKNMLILGIATDYGLGGAGIESRWGRDFPHLSRPALEPTKPPVVNCTESFPGIESDRPARDALLVPSSGVPRNFFGGFNKFSSRQGAQRTGSRGGSPLVRGSALFGNQLNKYSY